MITNVFNDDLLKTEAAKDRYNQCLLSNESLSPNIKSLIIDRTNTEWMKISSQKLLVLIERLLDILINHENNSVHLSLVKFCSEISNKCYFSLNDHLSVLLKVLVTFAASGINNEITVGSAIKGLLAIEEKELLLKDTNATFLLQNKFSTVNKCMSEVLMRLPRLMSNSCNQLDEHVRIGNLKTLFGYLKLAGSEKLNNNENEKISLSKYLMITCRA